LPVPKKAALQTCSGVWYFIGFNAEYLRCKGVCHDSQTVPLDAPLVDCAHGIKAMPERPPSTPQTDAPPILVVMLHDTKRSETNRLTRLREPHLVRWLPRATWIAFILNVARDVIGSGVIGLWHSQRRKRRSRAEPPSQLSAATTLGREKHPSWPSVANGKKRRGIPAKMRKKKGEAFFVVGFSFPEQTCVKLMLLKKHT